jgi:DNA replication protein DnaC
MRAATEKLAQRRTAQAQEYRQRRETVYAQLPQVAAIHRQLRQTVASAAVAAFRSGGDPVPALKALEAKNLSLQKEAEKLLKSKGYPADYLDEKPLCPLCKDSGWVGAAMCGCLQSLCTEEQNKQLSSLLDLQGQSFDVFRLDYYGGAYSSDRAAMQTVYTTCKGYAEQFATFPIRNLLMSGPPGVGKTFLSACIARSVSGQGFSVVYDTTINVFSRFEAAHFTRDEESQVYKRRYLRCDLLILDDLGINNVRQQKAILGLANAEGLLGRTITQANSAWTQNTALNAKAAVMYETTEAKLTMMNNSVDNVKTAIGDAFTPVIGAAADALTGMLGPVADFIEQNPALVQGLGTAIAVIGGLTAAVVGYTAVAKIATAVSAALSASMAHFLLIGAGIAAVVGLFTGLASALSGSQQSMQQLDEEFDTMNATFAENQNIVDLCEKYKQLSGDASSFVDSTKKLEEFPDIDISLTATPVEDVESTDFMVGGDTDVTLNPDVDEKLESDDLVDADAKTVDITPEAANQLDPQDMVKAKGVTITAKEPDDTHKLSADVFVNGKKVQFEAEWENREAMLKDIEAFKKSATDAKTDLEEAKTKVEELTEKKNQLIARIANAGTKDELSTLKDQLADVSTELFMQEGKVNLLETAYDDAAGKYVICAQAAQTLSEKDAELAGILNALGISTDSSTGSIEEQTAAIMKQIEAKETLAKANIAQTRADIYGNINEQAKQYAKTMRETAEAQDHFDRAVADSDVTNRYAAMSAEEISAHYKELLNTLDEMEEKEGFSPDAESYKEVVAEANELYNILTGMPDDWSEYADGMTDWADCFEYVAGNAENWNQIIADINEDIATYGKIVGDADSQTTLFLDNLVEGINTGAVSIDEVETLLTAAFANEKNGATLLAEAMEYVRAKTEAAAAAQQQMADEADGQAIVDKTQPIIARMNELAEAYNAAYDAAYNSINGQFELFEKVELPKQSENAQAAVDDMIASLNSQTAYMDQYATNLQKASAMGIDDGLIKKLSDGSTESAQILADIVAGGSTKIDELNAAFGKVEEGKAKFANTVADMETDFSSQMEKMKAELDSAVEEMNQTEYAAETGAATVKAFADAAAGNTALVDAAFAKVAAAAQRRLAAGLKLPGFAGGTDNAPEGFAVVGEHGPELVYLNGGEKILDAGETQQVMSSNAISAESGGSGGSGGGVVIEFKPQYNITGSMNADELYTVLEEHDANMRGQLEDILHDIDTDKYRREYV